MSDEVYNALRETPAGAKMLKLAEEQGFSPLEWAELPDHVGGIGDPWENLYLLSSKYREVRPELLTPLAAHEIQHGEPWDPVVMESLTREFGLEHLLTEAPLTGEARPTPTGKLLFGPTDTGRLLLELRSYRTELEVWKAIRPQIDVKTLSGPEIDLVVSYHVLELRLAPPIDVVYFAEEYGLRVPGVYNPMDWLKGF